jgi:hypothetical protein
MVMYSIMLQTSIQCLVISKWDKFNSWLFYHNFFFFFFVNIPVLVCSHIVMRQLLQLCSQLHVTGFGIPFCWHIVQCGSFV